MHLRVGKPSWRVTSHPGQLSLAIHPWIGAVSSSKSWGINRHTPSDALALYSLCRSIKLMSGWGLNKRKYAPLYFLKDYYLLYRATVAVILLLWILLSLSNNHGSIFPAICIWFVCLVWKYIYRSLSRPIGQNLYLVMIVGPEFLAPNSWQKSMTSWRNSPATRYIIMFAYKTVKVWHLHCWKSLLFFSMFLNR